MGLLYNYTYLNANGYLQKFRNALNAPKLDRATLTKILKIYNDRHKLKGFIVPPEPGAPNCLYYKDTLNNLLGIDRTGYEVMKRESNWKLREIEDILHGIEAKELFGERPKPNMEYGPNDCPSPEEDMDYVSAQLANLEENKMKGKRIIMTESQFSDLKKRLAENYFVETNKVEIVKKYLDENFVRGGIPAFGEDGYPTTICVVGMKMPDGSIGKNMTAKQLFYLLQDKFQNIYEDHDQRDAFLKKIIVDWFYKRIKHGLLSKNNY